MPVPSSVFGCPGKSVAGKISEEEPIVDQIKIDLAGLSRYLGYARKPFSLNEFVDQAGLATVGSSGDRYLRKLSRRILPGCAYRARKFDLSNAGIMGV
jgi:hypothetical protein